MRHATLLTFVLFFTALLPAQEWERQHPFDDMRDVLDIGMCPNGFGVMVGEDGLVMQTQDFGQSWAYTAENFVGTHREAACAPNGDGTYTTWIAGNDLWRSTDDGQSWEKLPDPEGVGSTFFMNVLQPDELFIANYVTLLKTADGGSSWEEITPDSLGFISNFFFLDSDHGWVGNRDGQLFITQDGGQNWDKVTIAEGLEEYVEPLFIDELNGYASLREDFYQTTDGGYTWEKIADNAFGNYTDDMMFMDEAGQAIVATSFDKRIYQSVDGGLNWTRITPPDGGFVYGLEALPDGQVWVGGEFRSVFYSSGAGTQYVNQIPGIRESLQEIAFLDLNLGWAVGGSAVLKTTDGGGNWEAFNLFDFTTENSFKQVLILSEQEVWISGNRKVLRTTTGGTVWEEVLEVSDDILQFALEKVGNSIMLVSRDGLVYRTEDDGVSWESTSVAGIDRLRTLAFANDDVGYAVGSQSSLIKTTDGGASWSQLSADLPEGLNILDVHFMSPDTGWIVNRDLSDHIWKTVDGGLSWTPATVSANTYWQGVTFANDTLGYLFGGSSIVGKVYQTTDGGDSWSAAHSINLQINDVYVAANESTRSVWTAGLGGNIERQETDLVVSGTRSTVPQALQLAPNPASGTLYLQLPDQLSPNARIEVYSTAGQLISQQVAAPYLSTTHWPPGLYLVRLTDGRSVYQAKVIKAQP